MIVSRAAESDPARLLLVAKLGHDEGQRPRGEVATCP